MRTKKYFYGIDEDDGGDFLRDQHEDWVRSGRKEEAELEALGFYGEEE